MDVEYLRKRLRCERRLARRAKNGKAIAAHRELADHYAQRLAQLGGREKPGLWFMRLWRA